MCVQLPHGVFSLGRRGYFIYMSDDFYSKVFSIYTKCMLCVWICVAMCVSVSIGDLSKLILMLLWWQWSLWWHLSPPVSRHLMFDFLIKSLFSGMYNSLCLCPSHTNTHNQTQTHTIKHTQGTRVHSDRSSGRDCVLVNGSSFTICSLIYKHMKLW